MGGHQPKKTPTGFALDEDRTLCFLRRFLETSCCGPPGRGFALQGSLPNDALTIVATGSKTDREESPIRTADA
jgi:hypothetical protein